MPKFGAIKPVVLFKGTIGSTLPQCVALAGALLKLDGKHVQHVTGITEIEHRRGEIHRIETQDKIYLRR